MFYVGRTRTSPPTSEHAKPASHNKSMDQYATRTSLQEMGGVVPLPSDNAGQQPKAVSSTPAELADATRAEFKQMPPVFPPQWGRTTTGHEPTWAADPPRWERTTTGHEPTWAAFPPQWERTTTGHEPTWAFVDNSKTYDLPLMPNESWVHFLDSQVGAHREPLDKALTALVNSVKSSKLGDSNLNSSNSRDKNIAAMRELDAGISALKRKYGSGELFELTAMDILTGKAETLFSQQFQRGALAYLNEVGEKEHARLQRTGTFVPKTALHQVRLEGGVNAFTRAILKWLDSDREIVRALSAIAGHWEPMAPVTPQRGPQLTPQRGRQSEQMSHDAVQRGRSSSRFHRGRSLTRSQSQSRHTTARATLTPQRGRQSEQTSHDAVQRGRSSSRFHRGRSRTRSQSQSRHTTARATGGGKQREARHCSHCQEQRPKIAGSHNTAYCRYATTNAPSSGGTKSTPSGRAAGAQAAGGAAGAVSQHRRM